MSTPLPRDIDIRVYGPDYTPRGFIGTCQQLTATPRHNQQPSAELKLASDDPKVALLTAPGSRVVIRFRDEHLVGGVVQQRAKDGSVKDAVTTLQIEDDWAVLPRTLLWQVPGAGITHQDTAEYDVRTGPAETVLKGFMTAAKTRYGAPWTIGTDLGRGDTITVQARMDKAGDVLFPLVDQAGIGVTVRQSGAGLLLDCYEPTTWPIKLSEAGGTITEGSWSLTPPTLTRVVLAADGSGTGQYYRALADTTLEATWGFIAEQLIDAGDLNHLDPNFEALATARMQAALAAANATTGLSLTLLESDTFRYGGTGGVHVGDTVTAQLAAGGDPISDVLRSATLTWSADKGITVTPTLGEHTSDPFTVMGRAIWSLFRGQRRMQSRR